ncbi:unnamed protein product [Microthlaspi erraticum]|uniref:NYN domain-containing protein n=1 Tax=Microthlaspi erraticum TaxID=1685480 RepID=A0A6D2IZH8_9BRAS|nr:unnamed protein product [Microthlaspi erraticum]
MSGPGRGRGRGLGRVSLFNDLSEVETGVFWNMAECPIPEGMDITSVVGNITKSLNGEGFNGRITVYAYDDISRYGQSYTDANVITNRLHLGDGDENLMMTISDFLCWAARHRAPANIMVESREIFDDSIDKAWLWDHLASGRPALSPPPNSFWEYVTAFRIPPHPDFPLGPWEPVRVYRNSALIPPPTDSLTELEETLIFDDEGRITGRRLCKSMQTKFMELNLKEISSDEAHGLIQQVS